MEMLSELITACRAVDTDKVTERKRQIDKIERELRSNDVVMALDKTTDAKHANTASASKLFGWDSLFKIIKNLVWKEAEVLRKAKDWHTTANQKRKQEVLRLFKTVIRLADKRGPRLSAGEMAQHITQILTDEFTCQLFGQDHTSILLTSILPVHKYSCQLTPTHWHRLLAVHLSVLQHPPVGFSRVPLSQAVRCLVRGAASHVDSEGREILPKLRDLFITARQEQSSVVVEHLVCATHTLCLSLAARGRTQVCRLGEDILVSLLHVINSRPSSKLKDAVVDLLQLIMVTHHPRGVRTEEDGAYAVDWSTWKSHLRKLYELMYDQLQETKGRGRFSSSREVSLYHLKENFVCLSADVCHQVFADCSSDLDVTLLSGNAAKKRRIASGWTSLRDELTVTGAKPPVIPWLQLLTAIAHKFPGSILEDELAPLISCVYQLLTDARRQELLSAVLSCLCQLANSCTDEFISEHTREMCAGAWANIWRATIRILTLRHCQKEGFTLLSILLTHNLITLETDIWSLYLPHQTLPTHAAVCLLNQILQTHVIPENHSTTAYTHASHSGPYSLRLQLLDWLLPSCDDLAEGQSKPDLQSIDCVEFGELLVRLTLTDTDITVGKPQRIQQEPSWGKWKDLEEIYLKTSFHIPVFAELKKKDSGKSLASGSESGREISVVCERMMERLEEETRVPLDTTEPEVCQLEMLTWQYSVLMHVLYSWLQLSHYTVYHVIHTQLYSTTQGLISHISSVVNPTLVKDSLTAMTQAVQNLHNAWTNPPHVPSSLVPTMTELKIKLTPASVLDTLLEVVKSVKGLVSTPSVVHCEEDDMFGDTDSGTVSLNDDFDESTDVSASVSRLSVMDGGQETEEEKVNLQIIDALCVYCSLHTPEFVSKLVALVDEQQSIWQPETHYNLQLLVHLVRGLCGLSLSDDDVEILIESIRLACKCHRSDPIVCCVLIDLLSLLVPLLSGSSPSPSLSGSREVALQLLQVFWNSCLDKKYPHPCRQAVTECLRKFVQHDPGCVWTHWRARGGGRMELRHVYHLMLKDPDHRVTMQAASGVHSLFEGESSRTDLFSPLYTTISEVLVLQGRQSPDEQRDAVTTRTSSSLLALSLVACVSPQWEKSAVFAICQRFNENNIDVNICKKVLGQIAVHLSYRDLHSFMTSHGPHLVHQWLESQYTLTDFPYQLMDYDTYQQFTRSHLTTLASFLLMRRDIDQITSLASLHSLSPSGLLHQATPSVLVHILPLFAVAKSKEVEMDPCTKLQADQAIASLKLLNKYVNEKFVEDCIADNLEELVVNILMTLYDDDDIHSPRPNPPFFSSQTINLTLNYLTQGRRVTSLVSLLSKKPDTIQRVLLALALHLTRSHRDFEKRRIFSMYEMFVRQLLAEFHLELGGSWAFVLRDVSCRLRHIMTASTDNVLTESCCGLLHLVCKAAAAHCPEELGRFLPSLVSQLVTHASQDNSTLAQMSVDLLSFLLVTSSDRLRPSIHSLDPLPDLTSLQPLHAAHTKLKYDRGSFTLSQEVCTIVGVRADSVHGESHQSRADGLVFLYQQLTSRPQELRQLVAENKDHIVERLVHHLIGLSQSSSSAEVREASARCLGALGPVSLHPVSVTTDRQSATLTAALEHFKNRSVLLRNTRLFHLLDSYTVDPCVEVVSAASDVLKSLLATACGRQFSATYQEQVFDHFFKYLHPFKSHHSKKVCTPPGHHGNVDIIADKNLWCPPHNEHDTWIRHLVISLIQAKVQDEMLRLLVPVCKVKPVFCEAILPYLIHDLLLQSDMTATLSDMISHFFAMHYQSINKDSNSDSNTGSLDSVGSGGTISSNRRSVSTMLRVIHYLRLQEKPVSGRRASTARDSLLWIDVDFFHVAWAAHSLKDHYATLLYAEIWSDLQRNSPDKASQSSGTRSCSPDLGVSDRDPAVTSLMLDTHRLIADPDAVYGHGAGQLDQTHTRIKTYEHENKWDLALGCYDLEMRGKVTDSVQIGMLKALERFGTHTVLDLCLHGLTDNKNSPKLRDIQYEMAWKTTQWDLPTSARPVGGYNESVYSSLSSLRHRNSNTFYSTLKHARLGVLSEVSGSVVSSSQVYPVLTRLRCLEELETVGTHLLSDRVGDVSSLSVMWWDYDQLLGPNSEHWEPILAQRGVLLKLTSDLCTGAKQPITREFSKQLVHYAQQASRRGHHQLAEGALHQLQQLSADGVLAHPWQVQVEKAKMLWSRGEHDMGRHLMRATLTQLCELKDDDTEARMAYPQCLGIYGNWLAEMHIESPNQIKDNYLEKAVVLMESTHSEQDPVALDAYLSLARFADTQYQNIVNFMKSTTYEAKQSLVKQAKEDAEKLRGIGEKSQSDNRYLKTIEKQLVIDERELTCILEDRSQFLLSAIRYYLRCLHAGDAHDLRVFRLMSLWFDNTGNEDIDGEMVAGCGKIKSYKFLPLMYQLAARMSTSLDDTFHPTLDRLLERVVKDHPHHSLSVILALAHANKDSEMTRLSRRGRQAPAQEQEMDRVKAAKAMVERLRTSPAVGQIVVAMERLSEAYIQLANLNVEQHKKETRALQLPSSQKIVGLKNLTDVAVPTVHTKVDPTCQYKDIIHIVHFNPTYNLAGGINLPKIITCVGSDGVARRQLVKGKDDLRQDAVMQQVFTMLNSLLAKDPHTRARALSVRTYKVIPLSQKSGVLEWCEGTMPIGDYLVKPGVGAHYRYRPQDLAHTDCRMGLMKAGDSRDSKLAAYSRVCRRFLPVFRYFFLEKFPEPAEWYQRRLSYTHSVATNSIVGYILGLGDRHVQNILIDNMTAEVIHIDLGVAFEQGRILPTPETVPFRLTRDIVDGMGVAGVEGVYRRCCEKTLSVMRQNEEALLTILQVLLYDPLSIWTISPLKAYQLQHKRTAAMDMDTADLTTGGADLLQHLHHAADTEESVNKIAERVLLRLRQKLEGSEEGARLSISGQVNHLIQEATDPNNLCRLFPGWQPYI